MEDSNLNNVSSRTNMVAIVANSHLADVKITGLSSTAVPIREEFRCRRLWFFYHDLRAFTTSWIPLPIFLAYRMFIFFYVLIWVILHINARGIFGSHWLIYISDLAFALLLFSTGSVATLCLVYTIIYYTKRSKLLKYIPKKDFPLVRIYKQDNIPWSVKIVWALYTVAASTAVLISLGYWGLIYTPCNGESSSQKNLTIEQESGSGSGKSSEACSNLDVYTIHIHVVNVIVVLIDLFLSRMPYQFLHCFYSMLFTFPYIIFTIIYWAVGGTDPSGNPYIYSTLDYGSSPSSSFGLAVIFTPLSILTYLLLFLLAWLRDVIYDRISCCFRDIRTLPYQEHEADQVPQEEDKEEQNTIV